MVTSRGRGRPWTGRRRGAGPADPDAVDRDASWSGSNAALVVPTAASTRPQFGSSPSIAHLSRLHRAIARPTSTASGSDAAPMTSIVMALLAPSASCCIWPARSAQAAVSSAVNSAGSGVDAAAPLASSSTVSFVDMQPSVSSRSKVVPTASRSARVERGRRQFGVGGEHDEHRGQGRGQHRRALAHPADVVAGARAGRRSWQPCRSCGWRRQPPGRRRPRPARSRPSRRPAAGPAAAARRSGRSSRPRPRRRRCRAAGHVLGGLVGVLEAGRSGARVGAAGVQHDGADAAAGQYLLAPQHRRGLDPVGREDAGRRGARAVVDRPRRRPGCRMP